MRRAARDRIRGETRVGAALWGNAVQAVLCVQGHPNPVDASACRECGGVVPNQAPRTIPRPGLGVIRMSTGETIQLDRGVLLGRNPHPDRLVGGEKPQVVKVASPENDISRNHVEVQIDGWSVLVTDLSKNGTLLALPGGEVERLVPMTPTKIELGAIVSLNDEIAFRFEATP